MNKEQFEKWIMSMLYYRYKIKATENGEFLGMINDNLNQLINSVKEECAKEVKNVQNPYPKSVFPMDTKGYMKAIPDKHLRTAISGYCGRIFFDIAKKEAIKTIRDK